MCGHGGNVSDGKFFVGHISGECMSSGATIIVIHLPRTTIKLGLREVKLQT